MKDTVAHSSATLETYTYDARGYRITDTLASTGITTHLYYSAQWQVLEERLGTSTQASTQYVWSAAYIDAMVVRDSDADASSSTGNLGISGSGMEERLYMQQDANFNVTAIVGYDSGTSTWKVQERYLYDPYGNFTITDASYTARSDNTSSFNWIYLYQGGRFENNSSLFNFQNRDYSPARCHGHVLARDYAEHGQAMLAFELCCLS